MSPKTVSQNLEVPLRKIWRDAGAREEGADEERRRDRLVDVDPHEQRGVTVLRGRAHGLPESRAVDEDRQGDHEDDGSDDDDDLLDPERRAEDLEPRAREDVGVVDVRRALP